MFYFALTFLFFTLALFFSRNFSRLLGLFLFFISFFLTFSLALFFHKGLIHLQFLEIYSHLDF